MLVTCGLKAHSGWAALVIVGQHAGEITVVERRRIDLIDEPWTKQPYHAAEKLETDAAHELVARGIDAVRRIALREMRALLARERQRKNKVASCAVLVGDPMPNWSVADILAVHIRMHRAEGVLFRDILLRAARQCALKTLELPEKLLTTCAEKTFGEEAGAAIDKLNALGKLLGPPWGQDQKAAALAALIALHDASDDDAGVN